MIEHVHRLDFATYLTRDEGNAGQPAQLSDDHLRSLYGYPDRLDRPWIRTNFVSSIDGAVTVDGVSAGLGTPADKRVFAVLRELADVVVVGAGTVRSENYGGARTMPTRPRAGSDRVWPRSPLSRWSPPVPGWIRHRGCSPTPPSRRWS